MKIAEIQKLKEQAQAARQKEEVTGSSIANAIRQRKHQEIAGTKGEENRLEIENRNNSIIEGSNNLPSGISNFQANESLPGVHDNSNVNELEPREVENNNSQNQELATIENQEEGRGSSDNVIVNENPVTAKSEHTYKKVDRGEKEIAKPVKPHTGGLSERKWNNLDTFVKDVPEYKYGTKSQRLTDDNQYALNEIANRVGISAVQLLNHIVQCFRDRYRDDIDEQFPAKRI